VLHFVMALNIFSVRPDSPEPLFLRFLAAASISSTDGGSSKPLMVGFYTSNSSTIDSSTYSGRRSLSF